MKNLIKIKHYFSEKEKLNQSVEVEMINKNLQRILWLQLFVIIMNFVLILSFTFFFSPPTMIQQNWQYGVIIVHSISAIIVIIISLLILMVNKKEGSVLGKKIIQTIFAIYVATFGFAIILIDLPRAANIFPFIIVCMILGIFILIKPLHVIIQYLIAYALFFYIIGLNETSAMDLITNRVNGFVVALLSIFTAIMIWHSERNSMLQKRKIDEQQKKLEATAYLDELTGLFNRRKWIELLNDEFDRIKQYNYQSSMLLLDIDNFKTINDQYGHPAGDLILREISALLKHNLRSCDVIGRWGGEEFIVLLTNTTSSNALKIAESLRHSIEKLCVHFECYTIYVTVSIGLTTLDHRNDFMISYKKVDQALYKAKNNGKNRAESIT